MGTRSKPQATARGRPDASSSRDVEATILSIAEKRFAERGYAAVSIREIAEKARVNAAMIHYYFGNKESLLKAVLERALRPLAAAIETLQNTPDVSPGDVYETLLDTIASHPHLPYLVMREVMLPGGVMQKHFAENLGPRLGGALPGLLARESNHAHLRDDIPPNVAALVVMSLAIFPFVVRPVAEQVLDISLGGEALAMMKTQISEIVNRGLTA